MFGLNRGLAGPTSQQPSVQTRSVHPHDLAVWLQVSDFGETAFARWLQHSIPGARLPFRQQVPLAADATDHRAATSDCPRAIRPTSPLGCIGLIAA